MKGQEDEGWQPTASLANLRLRAELLKKIRTFFELHGVLEVDTPALSRAATSDRHLASLRVETASGTRLYLHTSPEFPMKRLLAAGAGDIWQMCKVFRDGEAGRLHNPEFTLIEWYRLGFDHQRLMREVHELLGELLPAARTTADYLTYRDAFRQYAHLDAFTCGTQECMRVLQESGRQVPAADDMDRDGWLDLVAGELVYPRLGQRGLTFIYDYPATQAALARVRAGDPPVAERFEAFCQGIELGNGFHELRDADEQRRRFLADREYRRSHGLPEVPLDENLLGALKSGLPDCAGVALGLDRVLMLAAGAQSLDEVIAFPSDRA